MDCSLPGSSVHGIFPARAPEWGATAFSVLRKETSGYWPCLVFKCFTKQRKDRVKEEVANVHG